MDTEAPQSQSTLVHLQAGQRPQTNLSKASKVLPSSTQPGSISYVNSLDGAGNQGTASQEYGTSVAFDNLLMAQRNDQKNQKTTILRGEHGDSIDIQIENKDIKANHKSVEMSPLSI